MFNIETTSITEKGPKLSFFTLIIALSLRELAAIENANSALMIILNCLVLTAFLYYGKMVESPIPLVTTGIAFQYVFFKGLLNLFEGYCTSYVLCAHFAAFCFLSIGFFACLTIMTFIIVRERFSSPTIPGINIIENLKAK